MAATPIPTSVIPTSRSYGNLRVGMAATAIPAGSVVHVNSAGKIAVSTPTAQASSRVDGVAVSEAVAADQPIMYAPQGEKITASGFTAGTVYYLAGTGDIGALADVGSGNWVSIVGVAESATVMRVLAQTLNIQAA